MGSLEEEKRNIKKMTHISSLFNLPRPHCCRPQRRPWHDLHSISYQEPPKQSSGPFLGLMQGADNGKPSNRIIAVEFGTARTGFGGIYDNHAGIDVKSGKSSTSETAAYYTDDTNKKKISTFTHS